MRKLFATLTRSWARSRETAVPPPNKLVAIIVPFSTTATLTPDERVSLRHLRHFLGHYDKFILAPKGLRIELPDFKVCTLPRKFFGSAAAHARLLYDPAFYRAFADYKYIFFYHLDALAFSDQMETWCATDVDYIGAPWLRCPDTPWVKRSRVGNCGFALIKVSSALRVLWRRYQVHPATYWYDLLTRNARKLRPAIGLLQLLGRWFPGSRLVNRPLQEWRAMEAPGPHGRNTDTFWSDRAVTYCPDFKVASFEDGLRFAFEAAPRVCFEMNGRQLPFGCHAWARYDRAFWEPFLLPPEPDEVVVADVANEKAASPGAEFSFIRSKAGSESS